MAQNIRDLKIETVMLSESFGNTMMLQLRTLSWTVYCFAYAKGLQSPRSCDYYISYVPRKDFQQCEKKTVSAKQSLGFFQKNAQKIESTAQNMRDSNIKTIMLSESCGNTMMLQLRTLYVVIMVIALEELRLLLEISLKNSKKFQVKSYHLMIFFLGFFTRKFCNANNSAFLRMSFSRDLTLAQT